MRSHKLHLARLRASIKNVVAVALITFSLISSFGATATDVAPGADISGAAASNSTSNGDPKFEWTLEKMLMATAMPMTGAERDFLQTHPNLDGIRDWKLADFRSFVSAALGKKHVAEEAVHWRGIVQLLNKQAAAGAAYMHEPMPNFEKNSTAFEGENVGEILKGHDNEVTVKQIFEQMRLWRQQISVLAPFVESMRSKAKTMETSEAFERAIQVESNL